ncbi:MAG: high-potential iron-sulfur protein [Bdellovibrionales bacterium]|nr:high-potential iron-sulfur protein [Bdellovibrionales bacterium]
MNYNHSRRNFFKTLVLSVGALAVAPILKIQRAFAAHVDLASPLVKALNYVEDAAKADKAKRKDKKAFCHNCNYYLGDEKAKTAPCQLMANAEVAGGGWCTSWAKKEKKKA